MLHARPFPLKQSELNRYFHHVYDYLQINSMRLNISDSQVINLKDLMEHWTSAYRLHYRVANRSKTVHTLSLAMEEMENALSAIYEGLNKAALTEEDEDNLNLRHLIAPTVFHS